MRILQFLWRLSPEGGIPRVVRDLARGIDKDSFDLHICTARPLLADDDLDQLPPSVKLHTLDVAGMPSPAVRARMAVRLATITRQLRPDVLHVHSGTSWYATAAAPLVPRAGRLLEVHDTPQSGRYSPTNAKTMQTLIDRFGFGVVTHSMSVSDDLRSAWRLAPAQISRIPLAIWPTDEPSGADRTAARRAIGFDPADQVVLYVARLVDSKRPALFLDMAAAVARTHPRARFVLVGAGPQLDELRRCVDANGFADIIDVPGRVEDLTDHYRAASVFCSTSEYEGFGLALGEALVNGVPVVTTDVGGVHDVVDHGRTGLVVSSDQAEDLAAAVRQLLDDDLTRRRYGAAGRRDMLDRLSPEQMVASYEDLYRSCAVRELAVSP